MISFIIPAHNEERSLPRTLAAIHDAARNVGLPYEIVVVDDASTDDTALVARQNNALVVSVNHRQIAATRNSGGRAAHGDRLFFVDADTAVNARAIASALRAMDKGAVGGGAAVKFEGALPLYIRLLDFLSVFFAKAAGLTGGAFMFSTAEAFRATGGFSEKMFWGEEGSFGLALRREGRFAVLWERVLTSGRRFRTTSGLQILATLIRTALMPRRMLTRRSAVEKLWYDSDRARDDQMPRSLSVRFSNGIALLVLLAAFSGPVWAFIPLAWTPFNTPLGIIRLIIGVTFSHVGLIWWAVGVMLSINLFRQKHWRGVTSSIVVLAFCFWQAWDSTLGVIWAWSEAWHWLQH